MPGVKSGSSDTWKYSPGQIFGLEEGGFKEDDLPISKYKAKGYDPVTKTVDGSDIIKFENDLSSGTNEIYQLTDSRAERESTITPSERYAFQKIFSDIFSKTELGLGNSTAPPPATTSLHSTQAKSQLADIFSIALRTTTPSSTESKQEAVNRYPPALRAAAAKAIGLDENAQDSKYAERVEAHDPEHLEKLREPERVRVEAMMKAAKSDFELWDILEREVFPLISKLGLGDTSTTEPSLDINKRGVSKGTKKRKTADATAEGKAVAPKRAKDKYLRSIDGISPLALYGPLYPSYLLLGLRLLDRSFSKPSPLALNILPKIKSLGFISHVLGGTTQLYNELMRIYRYRHDNFRGIMDLLIEMESSALEMDEDTFDLVLDIINTQHAVMNGSKGNAIQALWYFAEFMPSKFNKWRTKIDLALREREEDKEAPLGY